jgi:Fe-S-cluster containining protein
MKAITCDGCGVCCMEVCSPPFHPSDVEDLPRDVLHSYREGVTLEKAAGWSEGVPCFWLDCKTKRCRHYEHRPESCRDFVVGDEACLAWRNKP